MIYAEEARQIQKNNKPIVNLIDAAEDAINTAASLGKGSTHLDGIKDCIIAHQLVDKLKEYGYQSVVTLDESVLVSSGDYVYTVWIHWD